MGTVAKGKDRRGIEYMKIAALFTGTLLSPAPVKGVLLPLRGAGEGSSLIHTERLIRVVLIERMRV